MSHDLLTPREVADVLRLSLPTVYRLGQQGYLPRVMIGRSVRYRRADLDRLLASGTAAATERGQAR